MRAMNADAGNTGRDPICGDNNEFPNVDLYVPLRHPNRNIGNIVGNMFLESKSFKTIHINL